MKSQDSNNQSPMIVETGEKARIIQNNFIAKSTYKIDLSSTLRQTNNMFAKCLGTTIKNIRVKL